MDQKTEYKALCAKSKRVPLFLDPVWLDAITQGNWDVVLAKKGDEILGALPYHYKRKLSFRIITMPPLTPFIGPVLFYPEGQKSATKLSFEKEILGILIDQLPATDKHIQYLLPDLKNGLPFHWKGFERSVRYTYIIEDTSSIDNCWNALNGNIRRAINNAEKQLTVIEITDAQKLYEIQNQDYTNKGLELNYDQALFSSLFEAVSKAGMGKIIGAQNSAGELVAAIFLGHDHTSTYYISGAMLPDHRSSGALSLLLWQGIKYANENGLRFNFNGSMVESIERYFSSFGAEQVPYLEVKKTDSKILHLLKQQS